MFVSKLTLDAITTGEREATSGQDALTGIRCEHLDAYKIIKNNRSDGVNMDSVPIVNQ